MIILGVVMTVLVIIGLFFWYLAYSSTTDISQDPPFKNYLNKSFIVKQPAALR